MFLSTKKIRILKKKIQNLGLSKIKEQENLKKQEIEEVETDVEDTYDYITTYSLKTIKVRQDEIESFGLSAIPTNKLLICDVEINKCKEKTLYNMKIVSNEKRLFLAEVENSFKRTKVKIYLVTDDDYRCIGQIKSNFLRNNFVVKYIKKNQKNKILNVRYGISFCGLFGKKSLEVQGLRNKATNENYHLKNKVPKWSREYQQYRLDFNHRVKMKSPKNFILEEKGDVLQCGKINNNTYALDFTYPLSPFTAFSICITSLVSKFSCD